MYGIAEQAAKLIRATYNGVGWPSNSSSSTSTTSTSPSATTTPQDAHDSGAAALSSPVMLTVAAVLASLLL